MLEMSQIELLPNELGVEDRQILGTTRGRQPSIEELVATTGIEQGKVLSSIRRLISDGYLQLVIIAYSWGVEFRVQSTPRTRPTHNRKAKLGTIELLAASK